MAAPAQFRLQQALWRLETGAGPRVVITCVVVLGFLFLAYRYDSRGSRTFTNPEAMEAADLARNIAAHRGYVTYSIRPLALGLLERADTNRLANGLGAGVPDLSVPPAYPLLLSGLLRFPRLNFTANRTRFWSYQPELAIVVFNEIIFFGCVVLVFFLAKRMFDAGVGWVSAVVFAGNGTYWRFCVSGLSTICLVMVVLMLVWCLVELENWKKRDNPLVVKWPLFLAASAGGLIGLGGLTRYSFAWLLLPLLVYLRLGYKKLRWEMMAAAMTMFLLFFGPWIGRNIALSHTAFGTAGFAPVENTRPFEADRVERAFDPYAVGLSQLTLREVGQKWAARERSIITDEIPRLGGGWMWAFFVCGLLLPFGNSSLQRLRYFVVGALVSLALVQGLGQTYISEEWPEYNTENLLVLLGPLVVIFGTGFFFLLLDPLPLPTIHLRRTSVVLFAGLMCSPIVLESLGPRPEVINSPYSPFRVQQTAAMMKPEELMMSDIPSAVAWYGDRLCAWLPLNDTTEFKKLCQIKPVSAVYLTQRTLDQPFLSQLEDSQQDWDRFALDGLPHTHWARGIVPSGFPLTNAPYGYQPAQLFLSDTVRWNTDTKK